MSGGRFNTVSHEVVQFSAAEGSRSRVSAHRALY
jgi:hypothetical protein